MSLYAITFTRMNSNGTATVKMRASAPNKVEALQAALDRFRGKFNYVHVAKIHGPDVADGGGVLTMGEPRNPFSTGSSGSRS